MLNNECFYLWILTPVGISVECNCSSSKLTHKSIISLFCKIYGQAERKKSISRFCHSGVVYTRTFLLEPCFVFYTLSIVLKVLCPLTDRLQISLSQTAQLRTGNTKVQKFQFRLTMVMLLKKNVQCRWECKTALLQASVWFKKIVQLIIQILSTLKSVYNLNGNKIVLRQKNAGLFFDPRFG